MPDDDRHFPGGEDQQPPDHPFYGEAGPDDEDIPASLIFMEMMRRAAAQSAPPTPDVLPAVDLSKVARKPSAPAPEVSPAPQTPPEPPTSTGAAPARPAPESAPRRTQKSADAPSKTPSTPAGAASSTEDEPAERSRADRATRADRAARREQRRARMEAAQQSSPNPSGLTPPLPAALPAGEPPAETTSSPRRRSVTNGAPQTSEQKPAANRSTVQENPPVPQYEAEAPEQDTDIAPEEPGTPAMRGVWATPTSWRATYDPPAPAKTPAPRPERVVQPPAAEVPAAEAAPPVTQPEEEQERLHEIQRVQRRKRRAAARRRTAVGTVGGVVRAVVLILVSAMIMATIFTWVTSPDLLATNVRQNLSIAAATATSGAAPIVPTALVTPTWAKRVGVVSGHWGPENDPGAVCPDGLTEASINRDVAQKVVIALRGRGYQVDLLDEFDPRLDNYQATALLSIHTNDCRDYGEYVSGYLIAKAAARPDGGDDARLVECVALHYGQTSGLQRRMGLTIDMTDYHTFREIHPLTPAAILELGFMKDDRAILTEQRDLLAEGIVEGLVCFLEGTVLPANGSVPEAMPTLPSPLPPP